MATGFPSRQTVDLSGTWLYKVDRNDEGMTQRWYATDHMRGAWKTMAIPNNWYLTEVGDYDGTVWFTRSFRAPTVGSDERVFLRFNAVDYIATVWLNGAYCGRHEGYFLPFEFDVTDKLKAGQDNLLVVRDDSPRDPTEYILSPDPVDLSTPQSRPYRQHQAKALTQIKGHLIDAMHRPGSKTSLRADGNSGGIWQGVELVVCKSVQIKQSKIYTKIVHEDGNALVSVDVSVHNSSQKLIQTSVRLVVKPKNFGGDTAVSYVKDVTLQPGLNQIKLVKTIRNPRLWWTWDHGKPHLYQAEISLGGDEPYDTNVETFGVKSIEHDAQGLWYLNGKRIFLRGMRYLSSLWMSEVSDDLYRQDLAKMVDMDINSIRIGSHVEMGSFYDMCDELGLLVWQVFPFHYCVSDSDELIERAAPMMRDMVAMLYNHACIGMWSVFKEPKIYTLPSGRPNNYGRLCQIMYEAARTVDPIRWVHKGDYEEGVQNVAIGLSRPGDTDLKRWQLEPNIVEFGVMHIPAVETLKKSIPEDKLWPPDWDAWEYWGLFYNRMFRFAKIEMGNSLQEFIDNSQAYGAKSTKEQIEFLRQHKYGPVGSMYLYFWNDSCPMIGSGLFDYDRRPYKAYEAMKAVYTPVLVSLEWNKDPYVVGWEKIWWPGTAFEGKVWITNDHFHAIEQAFLHWRLVNETSGQTEAQGSKEVTVAADSAKVYDAIVWPIPRQRGPYKIYMQVTAGDDVLSTNYFDFSVY